MPAIYSAKYTNHEGTIASFVNPPYVRFEMGGLPSGLFTPIFDPLQIETPANRPAGLFQLYNSRPREVTLTLRFSGTPDVIVATVAYMMNVFWPDIRDSETGVFEYTCDNGVTRAMVCSIGRFQDLVDWINRFQGIEGLVRLPITLNGADPFLYDPDGYVTVGPTTLNDGTPVNASCANPGNADAWLTVDAAGAIKWLRITDAHGHVFTVEEDMAAGDALHMVLSPHGFTVTYTPAVGAAEDWRNLCDGPLPVVAPYTNNIALVSAATVPAASGTVTLGFSPTYAFHGLV